MDPVQAAKYELLHNKHYAEAVFTSFAVQLFIYLNKVDTECDPVKTQL